MLSVRVTTAGLRSAVAATPLAATAAASTALTLSLAFALPLTGSRPLGLRLLLVPVNAVLRATAPTSTLRAVARGSCSVSVWHVRSPFDLSFAGTIGAVCFRAAGPVRQVGTSVGRTAADAVGRCQLFSAAPAPG